ncbi:MAG TPA: hypothetical protein VF297_15625 [Pyrinomonadaceae bacterium]
MKREVFVLTVVSAAGAYLFYYVLSSGGGGSLAGLSASMVIFYLVAEWSRMFYRLGRGGGRRAG